MLRFLTFCFSKRLWWITAFKKRLPFTVHFVCILHRSPASPVEHAMTWQWWRGWMEGELHAVRSEADTANTENSTEDTSCFYWNCREGWIPREKVNTYMCQPQTQAQFQLWDLATVSMFSSLFYRFMSTHLCFTQCDTLLCNDFIMWKCLTLLKFSALWGNIDNDDYRGRKQLNMFFHIHLWY